MKKAIVTLLFLACAAPLAARSVRFAGQFAAEFGGEKLIEVSYTDGSKSSIEAGNGLVGSLGAAWTVWNKAAHSLDLQPMVGIKYTTVQEASNGSLDMIRYPLDLLLAYSNKTLRSRLAGGLTYHVGNKLSGSGVVAVDVPFKNSLGYFGQYEFFFGEAFSISLRYTAIRYEATVGSGAPINANNFGVGLGFYL